MKAEVRAKYITKWDDGRTILESPCKVNLITHEILHIGRRKIICSPYPNRVLDDYVEHLMRKYDLYFLLCLYFQEQACWTGHFIWTRPLKSTTHVTLMRLPVNRIDIT